MQQFSETSTSSTFSSSNAAGNSVISTSSILKYSEINISTAFLGQSHGTTSTTANSTITERTSSYLIPTTTAFYTSSASTFSTSSSGGMFSRATPTLFKPTPTPNLRLIFSIGNIISATNICTLDRSTDDGWLSTMAITIGVIVATLIIVSLSVICLLCLKGYTKIFFHNAGTILSVLSLPIKQVVKIEAQLSTLQPMRHMGR